MVFLTELKNEISNLDINVKRQLVEAYNAMGMEGGDDDDEYDEEGDGDVGQQTHNDSSFGHFADNNSKVVLMIRVSNVEFDIGCAPVTEETVKIIFNKPIDIVMSSDTMETSGENLSMLSCNTVSIPDLQIRLQESYMTSSNEISMKDLRLQQSTLTPIDGTHPPVKHTFIDLGVVDIFFSMSSLNSLYTFATAWSQILQNAKRDMELQTRMFWGGGNGNGDMSLSLNNMSTNSPIGNNNNNNNISNNDNLNTSKKGDANMKGTMMKPSPREFTCFRCNRFKLKLRNVPLQNLELIEISLRVNDLSVRTYLQ